SGHDGGMHVCMTGHSNPQESTPYYGAVVAKLRPATRNIPSYVWIQNIAGDVQPRYLTGGFLGAAYSPLRVGTDLDNPSAPTFRMTAFDTPKDVPAERLRGRQGLIDHVGPSSGPPADRGGGAAGERDRVGRDAAGREVPQRADLGHA